MAKHSWTNRTIPPLVVAVVIGCVWYAWQSRPSTLEPASASSTQAAQSVANAKIVNPLQPTIQKIGDQIHFSIDTLPLKKVQKVEFYVESQFVGTSFSKPYTVAVSENNLSAGNHDVMAKIYTEDITTESTSASFTARPSVAPAPSIDASDADGRAVIAATANNTPKPKATPPAQPQASLDAPVGLNGTASEDGKSATITWQPTSSATSYRVLRDGVLVATASGTGFSDTSLLPGHTYDYQIIAVSPTAISTPSELLAITMPSVLGEETTVPNDIQTPPPVT